MLQILCLIHFGLALVLLGFGGRMMGVITPIILFAGTMTLQYQCLMFYIFYSIMEFITHLEPVGLAFQNYLKLGRRPSSKLLPFAAMLCFLVIAIRYVYLAYKEFKIAYFDSIGMSFSDDVSESGGEADNQSFYDYNGASEL